MSEQTNYNPVPEPRPPNGGRLMWLLGAGLLILAALIAVYFVASSGSEDDEQEVQITPIQPVPAIVLTPLWDSIATLQSDDSVDPAQVEQLQQRLEELDVENVKQEDLDAILNDLDSTYIDADELRGELGEFLESEGFQASVLDVVSQANAQATQTQAAIECLVETLPEYTSVTAYVQPSESERRAEFIYEGRKYRVVARTEGALNTENLWFQIELDALNNLRGWVRSDLVAESDDDKCMAIAIR